MTDIAELGIRVDTRNLRGAVQDLRRLEGQSHNTSQSVTSMGAAFRSALAMAATAIGGASVINTLASFEQSMAKAGAVSRATSEELEGMRNMAKELGSTTEFTAAQAAEGFTFLGMAGFDAAQSMAALPGVLDLATAASMDLGRTADISSNILSGFGLKAEEIARVTDVMSATSIRANTNVEQLGQAMSYVAPVSASLGISIEDTSAAIGGLSNAGIQGTRAGTALRAILSRMKSPTDQAAKALDAFNVNLADINPQANSLTDILDTLADANIGLSEANELVGQEAGSALIAMIEQRDAIESLAEANRMAEGETERLASAMRDTLRGDLNGATSAIQGLIIELGDGGLMDVLRGTVQGFTDLVRAIAGMDNLDVVAKSIAGIGTAIAVVMQPLTGFVGLATAGAFYIWRNWDNLSQRFPGATNLITGAGAAIGAGFRVVRDALVGLGSFAMDQGALLVDAADLALQGRWEEAEGKITTFANNTRQAFRELSGMIPEQLKEDLRDFGSDVENTLAPFRDNTAQQNMDLISKKFGDLAMAIRHLDDTNFRVQDLIPEDLRGIPQLEKAAEVINAILGTTQKLAKLTIGGAAEILSGFFEGLGPSLDDIGASLQGAWSQLGPIVDNIQGIATGLGNLISELSGNSDTVEVLNTIGNGLGMIAGAIGQGTAAAIETVFRAVETLTGALERLLNKDLIGAMQEVREFFEWLTQQGAEPGEATFFDSVTGRSSRAAMDEALQSYVNREVAPDFGKDIGARAAGNLVEGFAQGLREVDPSIIDVGTHGLVGITENSMMDALEAQSPSRRFARVGNTVPRGFAAGIIEKQDLTEMAARQMVSTAITTGLEDALEGGKRIGGNIALGMAQGMTSNATSINNAAAKVLDSAFGTYEKEAEIASPSKRAMRLGEQTTEGFYLGMENEIPEVESAIDQIGQTVSDGFSGIATSIGDAFGGVLSGTVRSFDGVLGSIKSTFQNTISQLASTAITNPIQLGIANPRMGFSGGLLSGVGSLFGGVQAGLTQALSGGLGGMVDSAVAAGIATSLEGGKEIGRNVILGFAQGIRENQSSLQSAAASVTNQAFATMEKTAETASPSRRGVRLGENTVEGFEQGIENGVPSLVASTKGLTQSVFDQLQVPTFQDLDGFLVPQQSISNTVGEIGKSIEETTRKSIDFMGEFRNDVKSVFNDVLSGAKSLKDAVSDIMGSIASRFLDRGIDMLFDVIWPEARAMGGPVMAGQPYIVGERGPELMVPRHSGTIIPNSGLGSNPVTAPRYAGSMGASFSPAPKVEIIVRSEPGTVAEIARAEAADVVMRSEPGTIRRSVSAVRAANRASKSFMEG